MKLTSAFDDYGYLRITNGGPVRIQYKCMVPIYVFPEMKLPKQNYNVLSPNFHIHVSVRDLYIPRIGMPILTELNRQTDPGNTVYQLLTDT